VSVSLDEAANVERLVESSRQQLHVDRQQSFALAAAAEVIARRLDDPRLVGLCLRAQANALWASGSHAAAVERHERARHLLEEAGDEVEVARTLNASIQPLLLLGRYDDALRAGALAREIFERTGDEVRLARLDINLGNILHRQDRFVEALDAYERAAVRVRSLGDVDGLVSALHNTAMTLTSLMRFPEALEKYDTARALALEHAMPLKAAQTDYNVAWLFYLRGEYARAIDLLRATAAIFDREGDAYHSALCRLDLSEIYLEIGLNDEARELAEQARSRFVDVGNGYETAKALANVAIADGREGKVELANRLFEAAKRQFIEEKNAVWPSLIELYQATLLFQQGRFEESRRLAETAREAFARTSLTTKTVLCHLLEARIALTLGELDRARTSCDAAARQLHRIDAPALTYEMHLMTGLVQGVRGERGAAYQSFHRARQDAERLRGRLRGDELKIAFGRNKLEPYEHLVAWCLDDPRPGQGRTEEAFNYVEQAKSRSLLDLIASPPGRPDDSEQPTTPVGARIRVLRDELNWYYYASERETLQPGGLDSGRVERFQQELSEREKELARLLRELPFDEGRPGSAAPTVTLEELRAQLPADAVLLEYFKVRDRMMMWSVSRTRVRVVDLGPAAPLQNLVRRLQFQIEKMRLGAVYAQTFQRLLLDSVRTHLHALHCQLLGPVWDDVDGGHLIVVQNGFLHYVPYHALFDGQGYVIDRCTISYAPSASVFARAQQQPPPAHATEDSLVLAVADARAPLIEVEAREVAAVLPRAALFAGPDATAELLRARGRSCRVVHIASHGRFRPDSPMFSGIRLADGYLTGNDLSRLSLPAALVTLSGCATGQTVAEAGDEILGISRGLFAAGARSLMLSLWDVHDESTTVFMTSFYRALLASGDSAEAGRLAMLETRARHPHPYYWAPFALMGRFRGW
jgi:CHAT domain-containing protein